MENIDDQIKQEIFFQKYKYISIDEFEKLMNETYLSVLSKINGRDNWNQKRLVVLLRDLEKEYISIFEETIISSEHEIEAVTAVFLSSEAKLLDQKFNPKLLDNVFDFENDLVQGYTFNELFQTTQAQARARIKRIIAKNVIEGNAPRSYVKELHKSMVYTPRHQLLTAIRTYSKHLREKTKTETEKKIKDMKGFISLSTLDSRTSGICIKLDKEVYPIDKYSSRSEVPDKPPRHFNCRSILVRLHEDTLSFGRSQNGDETKDKGIAPGSTTFNSFLKRNPVTAQRILGPEKYDLYKSGRYNIKDFISDDGRFFTLDELKTELN